jgi:hypothetical protein
LLQKDKGLEDPRHLITRRDIKYLRWRYGAHPTATYYTLMQGGRDGELAAAVIFKTDIGLGPKVIVYELFSASPKDAADLLNELRGNVAADYLVTCLSLGSWKYNIFRKSGFRTLRYYRSYGRRLLTYSLDKKIGVDPSASTNWALSMGELEGF